MKYICPGCYLEFKDGSEPLEKTTHRICYFCDTPHTQKELLNWQANQVKNLHPSSLPSLIANLYRYMENEINHLKEQINERDNGEQSS